MAKKAKDYFSGQQKREERDAYYGLVTLMRRAIAAQDMELFQAAKAIEIVLGDVHPADMALSFPAHPFAKN